MTDDDERSSFHSEAALLLVGHKKQAAKQTSRSLLRSERECVLLIYFQ